MKSAKIAAPAADTPPPSARERILHSARELFYQEGIRATGVDRLIAAAGVTKVTFYRHFPSKNDLIRAFLEDRHRRWITWFADALQRQQAAGCQGLDALVPALGEWLGENSYRGCAFINSVVELGGVLPDVLEISRRHKQEMIECIAGLLPASEGREAAAQAIALAVDGAIVRAQLDEAPEPALSLLEDLLHAWRRAAAGV
jgi:AcrR family transcriptional regulator